MPYSSWHVLPLEGEHASSQPPNPLQDLAVPLPAALPRRSTSLSSLTSFSSSMSLFQPTPPLDPASPPMPIPDTFDLDFGQDAKPTPAPAWPQTPPTTQIPQATPTTPPRPTVRTMPATPPPSATRSSKSQNAPSATPSRPARPMPPRPTRATSSRARPASNASPCPRGRRRSPAAQQQQQEDAAEATALRAENRALRRAKWALENTNAHLRARLLTCAEQVRHAHAVEAQRDHAQRYVRALQKQVRSLGGFVVRLGGGGGGGGRGGDEDEDDGDDGDNEAGGGGSGDDGELPAAYVPEYFPDAARHPHKYTMLQMQREKALGKKTKPKLKN